MIIQSSLEFLLTKVFHPIPPGIRGATCGIPVPPVDPRSIKELTTPCYCGSQATHYTLITKNIAGKKVYLYVCHHHIKDFGLTTEKPKPEEPS